ncbi:DUF3951 domain-containing protein [Peribacillus sp. NPDC097675]|uniref:DUF3951 domain-containing protein n=1 Tax=Peribacillus sp. NPDC097675 TaxID=3390618 RepID=UPI003D082CCF
MGFVYAIFVISIIGLVCYRMIKKKSTPSYRYTPYDDITMGIKENIKRDSPIQDTKHYIAYEEKANNDKTV